MGLPRTFVGFSSTDIQYYRLMLAWKENENIDFDFSNCQLQTELNSDDEDYIKRKCRERLYISGKYILLIGNDTRSKHKYVLWEAEVAIEKDCTIFGVNLDKWRRINTATCPAVIRNIGAIFVPFSPKIIKYALENFEIHPDNNYEYNDETYRKLGYQLSGDTAYLPPKPKLF